MANAKIQEAVKEPVRVEKEKRDAAVNVILTKHKGKNPKTMSKAEIDELIVAICQILEIVDDLGNIK